MVQGVARARVQGAGMVAGGVKVQGAGMVAGGVKVQGVDTGAEAMAQGRVRRRRAIPARWTPGSQALRRSRPESRV